jgi:WD40 repeat protein
MKKLIIFISVFLYALIIEPKSVSHRSVVNDIQIIDGKVYSVSNDNTLKVWDKSLNLITTVYEKQNENFGNLYTVASNDKYILAAGIAGNDNVVFVHDKKTLNAVKLLKKDFNVINKLKFSPDKKILVIVSGDSLYFYNKNLRYLYYKNFYDYNNVYRSIYDVVFLDNWKVAFVDWDGYVVIYDIKSRKILKTKRLSTKLQSIDLIKNRLYVGGYDGYLYVFDKNLKLLKKILLSPLFQILHIKHSKNYIAIAGGNGGFAVLKDDKVIFKKDTGFSKAIAIDKEDIFAGSNEVILHYKLNNLKNKTKTVIYKPSFITIKSPYFSLNYDDIYSNFIGDFQKSKYHTINGVDYSYEITTTKNRDDTLIIYKDNTKLLADIAESLGGSGDLVLGKKEETARFRRNNSAGYRHRAVVWYKHYIISGGDYGNVFIYDIKSKSKVAKLKGLKDHIVDLAVMDDVLAVLDERGDIRLYNLSGIKKEIKPYLSVTLYKDKTFLVRSGNYFYTNDLSKAVCLKPVKSGFIKTSCTPDKKMIEKIISFKKPCENKIKTINLTSNIPTAIDTDINWIFNTSKYIILGDYKYYALNKKTEKLKKLNLPYGRTVADVLEKDGFIYILLGRGNIYKFDKNLNFIAKTTFEPAWFGKESRYLSTYKKVFIASRYKNKIYVFDKDLNPEYKIPITAKDLYYWTFINDVLYLDIGDDLIKLDFNTRKHSSLKVDMVYLKTPQNRLVIKQDKYYLLDKDFNKKALNLPDNFYDFYNGKKYFYALSNNEIVRFLDNKKVNSAILKGNIDYLAGIGEIGDKAVLVVNHKLELFDFKTHKLKLLTQPVITFLNLYVDKNYVVAEGRKFLYVFDKNLKLIKKIRLNNGDVYGLKNGKVYIKAFSGHKYAVDLKTFKEFKVSRFPETKKTPAYFSDTDDYIYYGSFPVKAEERVFKLYETGKYIVAWGVNNNVYVYDKKLHLREKIILDKRVYGVYVTNDGYLYYAVYDKIFRYKI